MTKQRKHTINSLILALITMFFPLSTLGKEAEKSKPNVLFIALDDLNDWIRLLDPQAPIRTPNLERLARRGLLFTRAYCASAACNPSRTAILTGLRPTTSGVYGNKTDWRRALPDAVTLPQHFKAHGYRSLGAGKIFHHHYGGAFHDRASFDDFQLMPDPPDAPMPRKKLNGLSKYGNHNTDWGPWPADESEAVDVRSANYVTRTLKQNHDRPFFLAAGIFRPHMPFFAPQRYFDLYPAKSVTMPYTWEHDLDDLPPGANTLLQGKKWFFNGLMRAEDKSPGTWKASVRAYQASASFADAQVGRILDALEGSPYADNTIIVLWSDHGFHLGEKEHWEKFALWEKTNHVPFIVVAPGVTRPGSRCHTPVSLIDIYPTLVELCGFDTKTGLDGRSLVPLLKDPQAEWKRPALMTYQRGNHAVRDPRWRYIRYADGSEELYDHHSDPHEWRNLAGDPKHADTIARLKAWLPENEALPAPDMPKRKSRFSVQKPIETDVFVSGEGGYHTYRIPSVIVTEKGTLLAFCEGRKNSRSDSGDIDLLLRRSFDKGKTWSPVQMVWDDGPNTCGNPCPVVDRDTGVIWLLLTWNSGKIKEPKIQAGFGKDSRRVFVTHSKNDGATWAEPREITARVKDRSWSWYATGPGAGIQIERGPYRGRLVIPCDHKVPVKKGSRYYSHIIYSDDHGASWKIGGTSPQDQVNECEVVELEDGRLMLNMRNYDKSVRSRQVCFSDDGGLSWQDQRHDPALIEPICQASIRRYRWSKGNQPGVLLFSNPASSKAREKLTIRASLDDSRTWPYARLLNEGGSAYSCLCVLRDGSIGCLYEKDGYRRIPFARFTLDWVRASD